MFNEMTLRAEIAKVWGEHGAHMLVYDEALRRANECSVWKALAEELASALRETARYGPGERARVAQKHFQEVRSQARQGT